MTNERAAYMAWERKLDELRRVRDEYIVIGDVRPDRPIERPSKVLNSQAFARFARLRRDLDAHWRVYLNALELPA